jgi:hypothetical protein
MAWKLQSRVDMQSQPRDDSPLEAPQLPEPPLPDATLDPEPHWREIIDAATD